MKKKEKISEMRLVFKILILAFIFFQIGKFCNAKTHRFQVAKLVSNLPYCQSWDAGAPPENIDEILNQKYKFLGSGKTCFAFGSEDGKYVIKFYNTFRLKPYPGVEYLPLPKKWMRFFRNRNFKLNRDFLSFKLAHDRIKDETGLIYLHINPTHDIDCKTTIVDPLGIEHKIDMDKTSYIVQRKAEMVVPHIRKLMEKDPALAKEASIALIDHILLLCDKEIFNHDVNFLTNYAYLEGKPVLIDIGPLHHVEEIRSPENYKHILRTPLMGFLNWIQGNYPELYQELKNSLIERGLFEKSLIEAIGCHNFSYLGKGLTCTAYESDDKQYVIKIFKKNQLRKKDRLKRILARCQFAESHLQKETGIVFSHLHKTMGQGFITLTEKDKKSRRFNLDNSYFIIQNRAELIDDRLKRLMQEKRVDEAKASAILLLTWVHDLYKKEIIHTDLQLHSNFGFHEDRPILIDLGCLRSAEKNPLRLKKQIEGFLTWTEQNYPEIYPDLCAASEKLL